MLARNFGLEAAIVFELPAENIISLITSDFGQPARRPLKGDM
jgi:hypothetical protein